MTLEEAIRALQPHLGDALVVHANGHISRRSFTVEDRPGNFYMIGSMGLASSIALGVALARPDRRVVIYDGDGNLLMNLGSTAMIAYARPANLVHVVFDNGAYASTGNQPTVSRKIPLDRIAAAAGYERTMRVRSPAELAPAFRECLQHPGPSFLLAEIEVEETPFHAGRVTHTPEEIRDRFRTAIGPVRHGAPGEGAI
jgi:thiamine pyrophosphate-dependent acetolactate synthase large subunit-like protein